MIANQSGKLDKKPVPFCMSNLGNITATEFCKTLLLDCIIRYNGIKFLIDSNEGNYITYVMQTVTKLSVWFAILYCNSSIILPTHAMHEKHIWSIVG